MPRKLIAWALVALIIILTGMACRCISQKLDSLVKNHNKGIEKIDIGLGYEKPETDVEK